MNTRAKGNAAERLAKAELEASGHLVERALATGTGSWTTHYDYFGAFDLIAINPKCVRFIQVTAGRDVSGKRKKIDALEKMLPAIMGVSYEVHRYCGKRGGWRRWVRGGGAAKWFEVK